MNKCDSWITEFKSMITDPVLLCEQLELPSDLIPQAKKVANIFPLRVTLSFLSRIKKKDINDPLLKQILPLDLEEKIQPGFSNDPLKEKKYNPVPGLLHKYKGRVLLIITGSCAIHCRYCFRRHFPYHQNIPGRQLEKIINYILKDKSIVEVILSGGDPLIAKDDYLSELFKALESIPHLKIVRLHTRLPIVLPNRISDALIALLTQKRLKVFCVIHCNHPQEIDSAVEKALYRLSTGGVTVFNQSVLLKGINDSTAVLTQLSYRLLESKVLPYYLHLLDKVQGAAHFEVDSVKAKHLYYELRTQLPGYLVPLLVEEKIGLPYKLPLV